MIRRFFYEKEVLWWEESSIMEKEEVLVGKESSIMRRQFHDEENSLVFFEKGVLLWERDSVTKRNLYDTKWSFYDEKRIQLWKRKFYDEKRIWLWKRNFNDEKKRLLLRKGSWKRSSMIKCSLWKRKFLVSWSCWTSWLSTGPTGPTKNQIQLVQRITGPFCRRTRSLFDEVRLPLVWDSRGRPSFVSARRRQRTSALNRQRSLQNEVSLLGERISPCLVEVWSL